MCTFTVVHQRFYSIEVSSSAQAATDIGKDVSVPPVCNYKITFHVKVETRPSPLENGVDSCDILQEPLLLSDRKPLFHHFVLTQFLHMFFVQKRSLIQKTRRVFYYLKLLYRWRMLAEVLGMN